MLQGLINSLDKTIANLLKQPENNIMSQVEISFAMPDDQFSKSTTKFTVNLFLYDIRENLSLRGTESYAASSLVATQDAKKGATKRAPVQVDFSYLITAWGTDEATKAEQEHCLLGEIMKFLLRYPTIPKELLVDALKQLPFLPRTKLLHPSHLHSVGEFWSAMSGKPKPTLNYTVTLAVDAFAETEVSLIQQQPEIELSLK